VHHAGSWAAFGPYRFVRLVCERPGSGPRLTPSPLLLVPRSRGRHRGCRKAAATARSSFRSPSALHAGRGSSAPACSIGPRAGDRGMVTTRGSRRPGGSDRAGAHVPALLRPQSLKGSAHLARLGCCGSRPAGRSWCRLVCAVQACWRAACQSSSGSSRPSTRASSRTLGQRYAQRGHVGNDRLVAHLVHLAPRTLDLLPVARVTRLLPKCQLAAALLF
jgi:hypothetical protein